MYVLSAGSRFDERLPYEPQPEELLEGKIEKGGPAGAVRPPRLMTDFMPAGRAGVSLNI